MLHSCTNEYMALFHIQGSPSHNAKWASPQFILDGIRQTEHMTWPSWLLGIRGKKKRRQRTNSFGRATEPLDGTARRFPEPRTAIIATFNENTLRSLVPGDNPFVGLDDTPPFRGATQNSGESPPPPLNARAMAEAKKGTGPRRIAAASNGPIQSSSSSDESANGDRQVGME